VFWDFLYKLNERDAVSQGLQQVVYNQTSTLGNASFGVDLVTVPKDQLLVILTGTVRTLGGTGQNCLLAWFRAINPAETSRVFEHVVRDFGTGLAGVSAGSSIPAPQMIVPPGWTLQAWGSFNGFANPNVVNGIISGVLVPRGSFGLP